MMVLVDRLVFQNFRDQTSNLTKDNSRSVVESNGRLVSQASNLGAAQH